MASARKYLQKYLARKPYSTKSESLLTRDFIRKSLYHESEGYFTKDVINSLTKPLNFTNLWGRWEYDVKVAQKYREKPGSWMTPVEIFMPYYSEALGNFMLQKYSKKSQKHCLSIYEVGGGMGTNALCILNFLKRSAPEIYKDARYTIIEISPTLAEVQRNRLIPQHQEKIEVLEQDFLDIKWVCKHRNPFIIAMEVLDNMPHDKVMWDADLHCMMETFIEGNGTPDFPYHEKFRPIQDKWINQMLEIDPGIKEKLKQNSTAGEKASANWWPNLFRKAESQNVSAAFIPTCTLQFFNVLKASFPDCSIIIQDFDDLPPPENPQGKDDGSLNAYNVPLVSSKDMNSGKSQDYLSYLVNSGMVDIFFATDFDLLSKMCSEVLQCGKTLSQPYVLKGSTFMKTYAQIEHTKTMSGFNPILEDFENTSFLIKE